MTCIHSQYDRWCTEGRDGDCDGHRPAPPPLQVMMASFEVAFRRMERSMIALGRAFQSAFEDGLADRRRFVEETERRFREQGIRPL